MIETICVVTLVLLLSPFFVYLWAKVFVLGILRGIASFSEGESDGNESKAT